MKDIRPTTDPGTDKIEIIYWVGGSAGNCPVCGNGNAMLDRIVIDDSGNRFEDLECRDCGHYCYEGLYRNVAISYNAADRVYLGEASDGEVVELAPFDDPKTNRPSIRPLMNYLKDYPTPETW
jgi:hypothetical protein